MAEEKQIKQDKEEKKEEAKAETKTEQKPEKEKKEAKKDEKKEETKAEKKKSDEKKPGKGEALAYGRNAPISTKHAIAICRAIKNKRINDSLKILEDVLKKKWAI